MKTSKKLLWQLYPSLLIILLASLIAIFLYTSSTVTNFYNTYLIDDLKAVAFITEKLVDDRFDPQFSAEIDSTLKEIGSRINARITIALKSGLVLGDSQEDPTEMTSYPERPEVKEALSGKTGVSTRYSFVSGAEIIYVALPAKKNGEIIGTIRAASPKRPLAEVLKVIYPEIMIGGLLVFVLAALASLYASNKISRQINELKTAADRFAQGDLRYRLEIPESEEIGQLALTMNKMAAQLHDRLNTITQQRNELEAILSGMVEAVIVVDTNERVIQINQAAEKLLEVDRSRVKDRSVQEIVRNTEFHRFVRNTLASQEPIEGEILFIREPEKFLQAYGAILKDEFSRTIGALIVLNDVTRTKALENIRKDFVANVSHELRTPVTSIKGFLETLKEGAIKDPETAEKFLDIIIKHTDRLNSIIEDLLSLSRLEKDAESGEIVLEAASINGVLEAVAKACTRKAQLKNIVLQFDCDEELIGNINPILLEQAIVNLVDNAIKYSDPGKSIKIQAQKTTQEITISVADEGCGISKEHLSRIFERFYRVDKARSRRAGGTGLGLSIVKHIVQAHKGNVTVESSPGRGSTFTIHLPIEGI